MKQEFDLTITPISMLSNIIFEKTHKEQEWMYIVSG